MQLFSGSEELIISFLCAVKMQTIALIFSKVKVSFKSFEDLNLEKVYVSGWGFLLDKKCTTVGQGPAVYSVSKSLKVLQLV